MFLVLGQRIWLRVVEALFLVLWREEIVVIIDSFFELLQQERFASINVRDPSNIFVAIYLCGR